jgi:glycosyltransferase involved in cell wall biosynthesis
VRILVLNWWDLSNPQAGGAERHLHEIFGRIARQGAAVTLLCCRYPGSRSEEQVGDLRIVRRGTPRTINLLAPIWVRAHAAQFDVVVEYTNKIPFLTPLYAPLPRLCVAHHINGIAFRHEFPEPLASWLMWVERALYARIYRRETFSAVSSSTANELIELGIDARRVHVIHNGADHLDCRASAPRSPTPLLLYTGRLKRYKNLDALLLAVRDLATDLPEMRLAIIGEGADRRRLSAVARQLRVDDRIAWDGFDDAAIADWLSAAWVAVNPSVKEGWGLGVLEAARYGVPTVGNAAPGLRDSIRHGETGLLVPANDPAQLGGALRCLLTDAALRCRLGENARRWASRFRWADAAAQTLRVIERL